MRCHMMYVQWLGKIALVESTFTLHDLQRRASQWELSPSRVCQLPHNVDTASACGLALDCSRGIQSPFVLVTPTLSASQLLSGETIPHVFLTYNADQSRLFDHSQFDVPRLQLPDDDNYSILDGPTVLWKEGSTVHLTCSSNSGAEFVIQHSIDTQMFVCGAADGETTVHSFWAFNWNRSTSTGGNTILLFIRVHCMQPVRKRGTTVTALPSQYTWLCLLVAVENFELKINPLQPDSFIPSDYGCIATCITPHKSHCLSEAGEIGLKCQFVVGTSYQQVVIFESGFLLHCVSLESVPKRVCTVEVSKSTFCTYYANDMYM